MKQSDNKNPSAWEPFLRERRLVVGIEGYTFPRLCGAIAGCIVYMAMLLFILQTIHEIAIMVPLLLLTLHIATAFATGATLGGGRGDWGSMAFLTFCALLIPPLPAGLLASFLVALLLGDRYAGGLTSDVSPMNVVLTNNLALFYGSIFLVPFSVLIATVAIVKLGSRSFVSTFFYLLVAVLVPPAHLFFRLVDCWVIRHPNDPIFAWRSRRR